MAGRAATAHTADGGNEERVVDVDVLSGEDVAVAEEFHVVNIACIIEVDAAVCAENAARVQQIGDGGAFQCAAGSEVEVDGHEGVAARFGDVEATPFAGAADGLVGISERPDAATAFAPAVHVVAGDVAFHFDVAGRAATAHAADARDEERVVDVDVLRGEDVAVAQNFEVGEVGGAIGGDVAAEFYEARPRIQLAGRRNGQRGGEREGLTAEVEGFAIRGIHEEAADAGSYVQRRIGVTEAGEKRHTSSRRYAGQVAGVEPVVGVAPQAIAAAVCPAENGAGGEGRCAGEAGAFNVKIVGIFIGIVVVNREGGRLHTHDRRVKRHRQIHVSARCNRQRIAQCGEGNLARAPARQVRARQNKVARARIFQFEGVDNRLSGRVRISKIGKIGQRRRVVAVGDADERVAALHVHFRRQYAGSRNGKRVRIFRAILAGNADGRAEQSRRGGVKKHGKSGRTSTRDGRRTGLCRYRKCRRTTHRHDGRTGQKKVGRAAVFNGKNVADHAGIDIGISKIGAVGNRRRVVAADNFHRVSFYGDVKRQRVGVGLDGHGGHAGGGVAGGIGHFEGQRMGDPDVAA